MESLFDKSTDELREAFVRARFAEPAVFARPDIEEWLEGQRKTHQSDLSMQGFDRYRSLITTHSPHPLTVEYLDLYATPLRNPSKNWTHWAGDYEKIVLAVLKSSGKLYGTIGVGLILVIDGKGFVVKQTGIQELDPTGFLRVVFAQWSRKGRKSDAARAFCCDAVSRAIVEARKAAETDFNEAVAVSYDGTEIVKSDDVAVILDNDRIAIYPASAFVANQILRSDNMTRVQIRMDHGYKGNYAEWILSSMTMTRPRALGQFLDTSSNLKGKTRLVTELRFCPSPLPDGGQEMRI